jgi:polyphosphate kinase
VVRREGRSLNHYVHLGTGNYHARTARLYTDYGLFTCNPQIGQDVHKVFLQLTSLGRVSDLKHLEQSPFTLHKSILDKIEREAAHARDGKQARIIAKLNALVEPQIIQALYSAARDGVEIDLIVRGMCALRAGVPGISDRIRVRSIIGRFLEHTRAYYFHNVGKQEVYLSSADWMERNFFRRVEVSFPLLSADIRKRVLADLDCYLQDNTQAWIMGSDGTYRRAEPGKAAPFAAQQALLAQLAQQS